ARVLPRPQRGLPSIADGGCRVPGGRLCGPPWRECADECSARGFVGPLKEGGSGDSRPRDPLALAPRPVRSHRVPRYPVGLQAPREGARRARPARTAGSPQTLLLALLRRPDRAWAWGEPVEKRSA